MHTQPVAVESEWQETDPAKQGIILSIEESVELWAYLQQEDAPPYWETRAMGSLADKAKSFHKYGPWE